MVNLWITLDKTTFKLCIRYQCLIIRLVLCTLRLLLTKDVQYVHWVMHKCIMVKVGGNEIQIKYVKNR